MRAHKYRAWKAEDHYGQLINKMVDFDLFDTNEHRIDHNPSCFLDHKETVIMQYTGVETKSGTPIFEGDILNFKRDKDAEDGKGQIVGTYDYHPENAGNVVFHCGAFRCPSYCKSVHDSIHMTDVKIEVVGNIYEHPELIEYIHETPST